VRHLATSSDPDSILRDKFSDVATADTEITHQTPSFQLFYNDVYEVKLPPRHRFPMGKYKKVRERVQYLISKLPQEKRESVNCEFHVSPLATFDELSTTHDPTYIHRFLQGDQTEREQRNVGFPWSKEGVDRALSSVGGTLAAACFVCEEQRRQIRNNAESPERVRSPVPSWAAHIAGGTHHAFHDYGEGFSVFSDMAVTANVVLDRYPDVIKNNVLMIDLDVHQGNGNAVLFQQGNLNDESAIHRKHADRVFTFSMHCSGNYFSPKQESDLDIELPIGCQDQAYLMTLNHWLKRFRIEHNREKTKHKMDLIIYQAGVDVLEDDRLGRMNLSPEAVRRRNELVYEFARDLKLPLVICMGGGYPKRDDAWKPIIEAHANVYFGAHQFLSRLSKS